MRTVTFTEFRRDASRLLDRVERGESINIQRHGRTIARIIPRSAQSKPSWKRPVQPLVIPGVSLSKVIMEERR